MLTALFLATVLPLCFAAAFDGYMTYFGTSYGIWEDANELLRGQPTRRRVSLVLGLQTVPTLVLLGLGYAGVSSHPIAFTALGEGSAIVAVYLHVSGGCKWYRVLKAAGKL